MAPWMLPPAKGESRPPPLLLLWLRPPCGCCSSRITSCDLCPGSACRRSESDAGAPPCCNGDLTRRDGGPDGAPRLEPSRCDKRAAVLLCSEEMLRRGCVPSCDVGRELHVCFCCAVSTFCRPRSRVCRGGVRARVTGLLKLRDPPGGAASDDGADRGGLRLPATPESPAEFVLLSPTPLLLPNNLALELLSFSTPMGSALPCVKLSAALGAFACCCTEAEVRPAPGCVNGI